MNNTIEALRLGKRIRAIGFDDAPFSKTQDTKVSIAGVVCSNTRFEGMLWGEITRDGDDSTSTLIKLVTNSKFHQQLHVLLLDGIAFGGFNIVDFQQLAHETGLPCITVMRKQPSIQAIDKALKHFTDYQRRIQLISQAGQVITKGGFIFQSTGIDAEHAATLLQRVTDTGKVPESLRLAHLIGSAVKTGESSNRA